MANYIVSAQTNPERHIRTNGSGLSKSIKTLLDEGYESVTVIPYKIQICTHKFEVGDTVRIVSNISSHEFSIGDIVEVIEKIVPIKYEKVGYRMKDVVGDWWWVYESDVEAV